jgi:hypothetical protein
MKWLKQQSASRLALLGGALVLGALLAWPLLGTAQDSKPADHAKHRHPDGKQVADKVLTAQLRDLQAKVAKLEAALKQRQPAQPGGMAGMGMGKGMMGMGMMDEMGMMRGGMGGMGTKGGGHAGMGMMDMDAMEMMGMMGMGSMGPGNMPGMGGMSKMRMASALPGFPGASHIYHVGATGFFLDHAEHIKLTAPQQTNLNRIKEKALLGKSTAQRKIDEAEQELWALTASDRPDAASIEAKVREIEKLRGGQRLGFIRSVGEAAKVLTDEQRRTLLGGADKGDKPASHTGH